MYFLSSHYLFSFLTASIFFSHKYVFSLLTSIHTLLLPLCSLYFEKKKWWILKYLTVLQLLKQIFCIYITLLVFASITLCIFLFTHRTQIWLITLITNCHIIHTIYNCYRQDLHGYKALYNAWLSPILCHLQAQRTRCWS